MDKHKFESILKIGETIAVEFKRCGNGIENDVYESVCSFLNRFGGDIFMGVLNDGTVRGVPEEAAGDMIKNFIKSLVILQCLLRLFILFLKLSNMREKQSFMCMFL